METKRDKILTAALRLIRQLGYRKVTITDIADAVGISRPTLYAEFASKEAIMSALVATQAGALTAAAAARLPKQSTLKARLKLVFEIWIVEPFADVVDDPSGRDLLANVGLYVPDAVHAFYARFEQQLLAILASEMPGRRPLGATELAHVLALATKGLKASSANVAELRALIDGLVAMAIATATR